MALFSLWPVIRLPTTLHLRHEVAIWVCVVLLTLASLQTVHQHRVLSGEGWGGDAWFIAVVALVQSRHVLLRLLVSCAPRMPTAPSQSSHTNASRRPFGGAGNKMGSKNSHTNSILGLVYHVVTWYGGGGQYYDPSSPNHHASLSSPSLSSPSAPASLLAAAVDHRHHHRVLDDPFSYRNGHGYWLSFHPTIRYILQHEYSWFQWLTGVLRQCWNVTLGRWSAKQQTLRQRQRRRRRNGVSSSSSNHETWCEDLFLDSLLENEDTHKKKKKKKATQTATGTTSSSNSSGGFFNYYGSSWWNKKQVDLSVWLYSTQNSILECVPTLQPFIYGFLLFRCAENLIFLWAYDPEQVRTPTLTFEFSRLFVRTPQLNAVTCLRFSLVCWTLMPPLVLFGRFLLPLPDLVAGSNVLKAIRTEAQRGNGRWNVLLQIIMGNTNTTTHHTSGTSGGGGSSSSGGNTSNSGGGGGGGAEDASAPFGWYAWCERSYRSVVVENRLRLWALVGLVRLVELLAICAWIPRTAMTCHFTGHCGADRGMIWTPSANPWIHMSNQPKPEMRSQFDILLLDHTSTITILFLWTSILVIVTSLLVAQAITLDGTYLATMGYLAGKWTPLDHDSQLQYESYSSIQSNHHHTYHKKGSSSSGGQQGGVIRPTLWDSRKRYKKGDLIVLLDPRDVAGGTNNTIYEAETNSPEGRPFDPYLRASHDWLRHEVGPPSTSVVLAVTGRLQVFVMMCLVSCILIRTLVTRIETVSLYTMLCAHIVALYATSTIGVPTSPSLFNRTNEFEIVAKEISKGVKITPTPKQTSKDNLLNQK